MTKTGATRQGDTMEHNKNIDLSKWDLPDDWDAEITAAANLAAESLESVSEIMNKLFERKVREIAGWAAYWMLQNEFWYTARMDLDDDFTITVGLGDSDCEKTVKLREFLLVECDWYQEDNREKFIKMLREVADHFAKTEHPRRKYQTED